MPQELKKLVYGGVNVKGFIGQYSIKKQPPFSICYRGVTIQILSTCLDCCRRDSQQSIAISHCRYYRRQLDSYRVFRQLSLRFEVYITIQTKLHTTVFPFMKRRCRPTTHLSTQDYLWCGFVFLHVKCRVKIKDLFN